MTGIARRFEAIAGRAIPFLAGAESAVGPVAPFLGAPTAVLFTSPLTGGSLARPDELFRGEPQNEKSCLFRRADGGQPFLQDTDLATA